MSSIRFFIALWVSKLSVIVINIIAKGRGTNLPGQVALRIDPLFVQHMKGIDPDKAVFVTGTNGKSTTVNLLHPVFASSGKKVCANLDGANMLTGVATALIKDSGLSGRIRSEYVVMETDERYLKFIRKQLPAHQLIITNIQKDQTQRNGEPGVISRKITEALGPDLTAFVNQDEPRSFALGESAGRAHADHHVPHLHIVGETIGRADADDGLHIVEVIQLIGVDGHGRDAHAAAHHRNSLPFPRAGEAQHVPHGVEAGHILQIRIRNEFGPQRITGHQDGLCDIAFLCAVVRGCHNPSSFRPLQPFISM